MIAGSLEIQFMADMTRLHQDMEKAKRVTGDSMAAMEASMLQAKATIDAMAEAERARASLFSRTLAETKRLLDIAKGASADTAKALANMKIDPEGLKIPAGAMEGLKTWREQSAYAIGAGMAVGVAKAKNAWEEFKSFTERQAVIWGVALTVGISAAVLGAVYTAFKGVNFAIGLLTGESYKSANIDALVAKNDEVKALQGSLNLAAVDAGALVDTLDRLGVPKGDYVAVYESSADAVRKNREELERLGIQYQDSNGKLLQTREFLGNVKSKLEEYTVGFERNAAAAAIGVGSYDKVSAALKITQEETEKSKLRLDDFNLGIGPETQAAVALYEKTMNQFNNENELTGQGFKRAIADNILPLLTDLASFFTGGFDFAVNAFRYSVASITSLLYGLKTVVYMVAESILGSMSSIGSIIGGVAVAAVKLASGDFSGAKDALLSGWSDAKSRLGMIGDNIVEQARHNAAAMKQAWAFDDRQGGGVAQPTGKSFLDEKAAAEKLKAAAEASKAWEKLYASQADAKKLAVAELDAAYAKETATIGDNIAKQAALAAQYQTKLSEIGEKFKPKAGAKQVDEEAQAYAKLTASIADHIAVAQADASQTEKLTAGEKIQLKMLADLANGTLVLTEAHEAGAMALLAVLVRQEKLNIATDEAAKSLIEYGKAVDAMLGPLETEATNLERQYQTYAKTRYQIEAVTIARLEEAKAIMAANGASDEHMAYFEREIAARKRIAIAAREIDDLQGQTNLWKSIENTAHQTFISIADGGKNTWQRLKDTAKNIFFDWLYQMTLKKWLFNISASISGEGVATSALGAAAAGGGGAGTNYLGLASNANTAYNLYNGSYLATAQSAYNSYVAGTSALGYTAPYWQTAAGAALSNAATPTAAGYGISLAPTTSTIPGVAPTYGMSVAPTAAPSSTGVMGTGLSTGAVTGILAIIAGMYMSGQAWQNGYRPDGNWDKGDAQSAPLWLRDFEFKINKALFGEEWAGGKTMAVLTGSSLQKQLNEYLWEAFYGGTKPTGITSARGTFSEDGGGFINGQSGYEVESSKGLFSGKNDKHIEWGGAGDALTATLDNMYKSVRTTFILTGALFDDFSLSDKLKGFSQDIFHSNTTDMQASLDLMSKQLTEAMGTLLFPSVTALRSNTATALTSLQAQMAQATKDGNTGLTAALKTQVDALAPKVGEVWSATFSRLLIESDAVSRVFDLMGKSLTGVFGSNNADGILSMSDNLVTLFGSTEALNSSFGAYYGNFYTQAEQTDQARKEMSKSFATLGQTMPTTREGFRALVDGLDLSTMAGEATFKALMDLQGGFAALTPAMEAATATLAEVIDAAGRKTWGDKLSVLTGESTQRQIDLANDLAGTEDDAVKLLIARVYELEDAATAAAKATEDMATAATVASEAATVASEAATVAAAASAEAAAKAAEIIRSSTLASLDSSRAAMQSFATAGMANITEAVNLEKQRIGVIRSVAAESVTSIKGVFSLLNDQVNSLYGTVASTQAMQAAEGSAFIANALSNAQSSGYLPDQSALSSAISGARAGLDPNTFATQFEADRAALVMAGQLSQLKITAGQQLPVAEQAVKLADEQLKALDDSLGYYKKQLDQLLGINDNTLSFTGAIDDIGKAIVEQLRSQTTALTSAIVDSLKSGAITTGDATLQLKSSGVATDVGTTVGGSNVFMSQYGASIIDGVVRTTNGFTGSLTEAKDIITGAFNGLSPKEFQSRAIGIGLSAAMIDRMYSFEPGWSNKWAAGNGLPQFAVGTNYVPKDMVAQIHEGEAIVPKAYNPAAGGGVNTERLERLVEGLTTEVQRLQTIVNDGNKHASRTANAVNGNPEQPMLVETV